MNTASRLAAAMGAVAVVAVVALIAFPRAGGPGQSPPSAAPSVSPIASSLAAAASASANPAAPSATNAPTEFPEGPLAAGTYTLAPFTSRGEGLCYQPPQSGCTETPDDDSIRFTVTVPEGWNAAGSWLLVGDNKPPGGAGTAFIRGASLLTDPCTFGSPRIPVGPTVADFINAVADHPSLDTTAAVDVELGGYSGKYFDLLVPADTSMCTTEPGGPPQYRPWEPGIYAQGPGQRWHHWVLDVDGVRVVVQSFDFPGTPATRRAELQAIVDSIQIEP